MSKIANYFDIDRMMSDNRLLLAYRDKITESTVEQLLSIAELRLVQTGEDKKLRKRVFNILVECLQNIVNHSVKDYRDHSAESILLIGKEEEGGVFIITGNCIHRSKVSGLGAKIELINSWEHDNMRQIYSGYLEEAKYSEKGGAGLGLIDIYRRSGRKLRYNIQPINDDISFLSMHISIKQDHVTV